MGHHVRPARSSTGPSQRSLTRPSPGRPHRDDRVRSTDGRSVADRPTALVVEVRSDLPRPRITVTGELDLDSAGLLTAMLDHVRRTRRRTARLGTGQVEVDVDLAGVTFADSAGVAPVLDGRVRVVAASAPVGRVLRLLRGAELTARDRLPAAEARPA